jgi:ABC-type polysaccharide/polyol phosphate transport system ATPase subunit
VLKVITRITEPTSGVSRTRGRVGSLLEVGTGFHPELTGRENVYLNGAILGMARREIDRRFDEIAEFSGVTRFLDTPVKRYSSGMYLRLAFAVAAHLDSDIMAIDEVLAVGDAEFQRKCLGKMGALEREGRTVVFVSHNLDAIARLCRTTVWLERGQVQAYGPTRDVIGAYLSSGITRAAQAEFPDRPGDVISLRSATLFDADGNPAVQLHRDRPLTIEARFVVRRPVPGLDITVFVDSLRAVRVLDEAWSENAPDERGAPGEYVARVTVPPLLAVGDYAAGIWIGSAYETHVYEEDVLRFRLEGSTKGRADRVLQLGLRWDVEQIGERLASGERT